MPKSESDENILELLCTKILDANKKAEQFTIPILLQFLTENGYEFLNGSFFKYYTAWVIIMIKFANFEGKNDVL
ncbi:hypothetical protein RCL_jg21467.t1 [Rhizophagus clarus]|uniref:Uncharacterized protein n=1 Tax=Rhizophagus clarus TaxID=94130 RepID=A0A8H3QGW2_9GLOM|nr:hypothetical protein RCL_jg21467.t1 [Rhizophagus clarus]